MASVTETAIDFIKSYIRHNTTYNTDQIRLLKFNETHYLHMNTNTQTHTYESHSAGCFKWCYSFSVPYQTCSEALNHSSNNVTLDLTDFSSVLVNLSTSYRTICLVLGF